MRRRATGDSAMKFRSVCSRIVAGEGEDGAQEANRIYNRLFEATTGAAMTGLSDWGQECRVRPHHVRRRRVARARPPQARSGVGRGRSRSNSGGEATIIIQFAFETLHRQRPHFGSRRACGHGCNICASKPRAPCAGHQHIRVAEPLACTRRQTVGLRSGLQIVSPQSVALAFECLSVVVLVGHALSRYTSYCM